MALANIPLPEAVEDPSTPVRKMSTTIAVDDEGGSDTECMLSLFCAFRSLVLHCDDEWSL